MLLLPNSPYFIIAFYAILKAGGTVDNANPLTARLELVRQIANFTAEILITLDVPAFQVTMAAVGWPGRLRRIAVASLAESLPFPKSWLYPLFHHGEIATFPNDERHLSFASLLGIVTVNLSEARRVAAAAHLHASSRLAGTRLLLPNGEGVGSIRPIFGGGHEVPARLGVLVYGTVGGEKLLSLAQ